MVDVVCAQDGSFSSQSASNDGTVILIRKVVSSEHLEVFGCGVVLSVWESRVEGIDKGVGGAVVETANL
jgi:hypothetical protein